MAKTFVGRAAGDRIGLDNETLIAATPEEMRGILNRLTNSALKGNMTPKQFAYGLDYLDEGAKSPNYIGRQIRNTMENPFARTLVNNPDLAEELAKSSVGMLNRFGVDVRDASSYIGPGMEILKQAKKDGLLTSDVSDELVAEELQRPLYSAVQGYVGDNKNNPAINQLIKKAFPTMKPAQGMSNLEAILTDY